MGILTRRSRTPEPTVSALVEKDAGALGGGGSVHAGPWDTLNRPGTAQLRAWSRNNEWVRAAIRHRREQVSSAKWIIEAIDPDRPYDPRLQTQLEQLFAFPNAHRDSFRTLIEPAIEDYFVIGWGGIEKEQNVKRQPVGLYHVDASRIEFAKSWTGELPDAPRYYFSINGNQKLPLRNDQLVVMLADPATDREDGLSTLEVLRNTIQAELAGAAWARDHMRHQPPNGVLHLGEGAGDQQVARFREMWNSEIAGQSSIAITGGTKDPKYIQFHAQSGGDLLQWELYFTRKLCAVFRISPQDLGITFDINRATAMTQADITRDSGLVPLLLLIEEYLNREIVWDFGDPDLLNLRFTFTQLNDTDRRATTDLVNVQINELARITINEARKEEGRDPIPGGDVIMVESTNGPVAMLGEGVPTPAEMAQATLAAIEATTAANLAKADAAANPPAAQPPADATTQASAPTPWLAGARRTLALALAEQARERRLRVQRAARARLTVARGIPGRDCPTEAADALLWALNRELVDDCDRLARAFDDAWHISASLAVWKLLDGQERRQDPRLREDLRVEAALRAEAYLGAIRRDADERIALLADATDDALLRSMDQWLAETDEDGAAIQAEIETERAATWGVRVFARRNALPDLTPAAIRAIGETLWTC